MIVKIDLTVLPQNIKELIIGEIEKIFQPENSHIKNESNENNESIDNDIINISLDKKNHFKSIEQKIKDILLKNRIKDYVVISNFEEKDKIKILDRKNSEKLGIYHCHHCGMSFDNEIQLVTHHRIHYVM
jgi:rubrerythrin